MAHIKKYIERNISQSAETNVKTEVVQRFYITGTPTVKNVLQNITLSFQIVEIIRASLRSKEMQAKVVEIFRQD